MDNRIISLSFLDPTAEFLDPTSESLDPTIIKDQASKGTLVEYYIFPDGLCINIESSREEIASIYYILKKPSPNGIIPFIQDITAFCDKVTIDTISPKTLLELLPVWRKKLTKESLLDVAEAKCREILKSPMSTDVTDIRAACEDLSQREDDHAICHRDIYKKHNVFE